MTNAQKSGSIILLVLLMMNCSQEEKFNFQGKWQSLNDRELIIEITEDNHYKLFRNKNLIEILDNENLKIEIKRGNKNWRSFLIKNEKTGKEFSKGRIEIVNKDRIRLYFHKHHQILDLADEFNRTENFTNFEMIMDEIMKEVE